MPPFQELLARIGVEEYRGATDARIGAFEKATSLTLPPEARAFFRACDGAEAEEYSLQLLSLDGAAEYAAGMKDAGIPQAWGYLPLSDADDSNPMCVCCRAPLAGYVVHVLHDDSARLAFRSVENFLAALGRAVAVADEDDVEAGEDVPYDFVAPERTPADVAAGRRLIEIARGMGDPDPDSLEYVERGDAFRFGMTLLSPAEVAEVAALLSVPDEYVQREVRDRLEEIGGPEARAALRAYDEEVARFVSESAEKLRAAGFTATVDGDALNVAEGGLSLNMPVFFARRHEPDAEAQFVERVKQLTEARRDRAPRKNKGHRGQR